METQEQLDLFAQGMAFSYLTGFLDLQADLDDNSSVMRKIIPFCMTMSTYDAREYGKILTKEEQLANFYESHFKKLMGDRKFEELGWEQEGRILTGYYLSIEVPRLTNQLLRKAALLRSDP